MIESIKFTNVNGSVLMFNEKNDTQMPTTEMTTEVDPRFTERPRSQQHGIYPAHTYWGKRLFHITGDVLTQTSAEYIQKRLAVMNALMPRPQLGQRKAGDLEILYTGMVEPLTCEATLDGYPELPMAALSPSRTPYQVNFKTFDPRCYGYWRTVDLLYGINENAGGRSYNKTYDKSYSTSASSPDRAIITNAGNYDTGPIVTFYGPVTSPRLTLQRSDGVLLVFALTGLVLGSVFDTVTVDLAKRTAVRWDGTNVYKYAVGSDWFVLESSPFVNTVVYSGAAGASPSHASIAYRNAYMI